MERRKIAIYGGGTFSHIRPHLSLSVPAFGGTALHLAELFRASSDMGVDLYLTKMAEAKYDGWPYTFPPNPGLVTNENLETHLQRVVDEPLTKAVIVTSALCDFNARIAPMEGDDVLVDPTRRLDSKRTYSAILSPEAKVLPVVRQRKNSKGVVRKDIFLVAFKTTDGVTLDRMFERGLELLKTNSCNLVLVNDLSTKMNMIVTPEESTYCVTDNRRHVLSILTNMVNLRSNLTFTQSTVVAGELICWGSSMIPDVLRKVVNHAIAQNAYKATQNATVGHFAVKLSEDTFLTSVRRSNFNDLGQPGTGMVMIKTDGPDTVLAYGAKPSVGGQSQRSVFRDHGGFDLIFHAHVPLRSGAQAHIPVVSQYEFECGSHQCGNNTSRGLQQFRLPSGGLIKAVMLDNHGPNILFRRDSDPNEVIDFIEKYWDLSQKTTGLRHN